MDGDPFNQWWSKTGCHRDHSTGNGQIENRLGSDRLGKNRPWRHNDTGGKDQRDKRAQRPINFLIAFQ